MGLKRSKTGSDLGQHAIFGDEEAAELRAELDDLREQFAFLTQQVTAQFTSIAAHASIAQEQIAVARDEARVDLDRARETLIGLIEQVRADSGGAARSGPGPSVAALNGRVASLESAVVSLTAALEASNSRQERMGETMAAFIDTLLSERRGEPVAGLALT